MGDQLRIARMIDGFHADDTPGQLRIMDANMFDQLGLGAGRPGDENGAGVRNGFGDRVGIVVIRGDVATPDRNADDNMFNIAHFAN